MSVRWQHCIDHADKINIQKPAELPDCLLGVVPRPTDSRLGEARQHQMANSNLAIILWLPQVSIKVTKPSICLYIRVILHSPDNDRYRQGYKLSSVVFQAQTRT